MRAKTMGNKQTGLTLIEMMIASLLGLIVTGGVLTIYLSSIRGSTDIANSARLNYDLDSVMQLMVNDIRRAGYWGGAISASDAKNNPPTCDTGNPFTCGDANIQIPVTSCILYSYDADGDGDVNNGEYYGFKLDGSVLKISSADTVDDTGDCTANDGRWQTIIDTDTVSINSLSFSMANSKCKNNTTTATPDTTSCAATTMTINSGDTAIETRQIDITLTGQVSGEDVVNKSLTDIAKVRNDRIFEQP